MIITDYYKFVHHNGTKYRFDCEVSTQSYNPFETLRNKKGENVVYIVENTHTKAGQKGKTDLAITHNSKHISSIFRPDVETNLGWGDVNQDALLFRFTDFKLSKDGFVEDATIEIFVARGYKTDRQNLYAMFADGELNDEIQEIVGRAKGALY